MPQPRWQTTLFAAIALLTVIAATATRFDLRFQILLLAPLVAVLGLPHGGLDLAIAEALWRLDGWRGKLSFAFAYLGLAAVVIALWLALPALALPAFLAYSMLHFSEDWQGAAGPLRWTGGVATVAAPAVAHRGEVAELFGYLAPASAAGPATDVLAVAGVAALVALFAAVVLSRPCRGQAAVEQSVLWIAALALQPLIYFTVYFCALHSIRHFGATLLSMDGRRRALITAAGLSALVIAGAGLVVIYLQARHTVTLDETLFRVIFIGLAALTVPHMILVDRFRRRHV